MAKVVFIQKSWFDIQGPMYISGLLKKNNHQCELFIEPAEKRLIFRVKEAKPHLIAFSLVSDEYPWAIGLARKLKQNFNLPIIFGGIHPTFCPEECLREPCVDIVCRGEGEFAILELLDNLEYAKEIRPDIENLWFKQAGAIARNPIRPLVENLDALPFPDRDIYYTKYSGLGSYPVKRFMGGRGCPYECSYCCNEGLKALYKDKGKMLRKRSPGNLIAEIIMVRDKWPLRRVEFIDDEFTYEREWLEEFLSRYKNEVHLPFTCLARLDLLDEAKIKLLAHAGCATLHFGIESGSERVRRQILRRDISNASIIEKSALLKKYGLKFNATNMLNIPGESIDDGFETVRLNAQIRTDYPWCSLLQPYPGSSMYGRMTGQCYSFYESSPIEQADSGKLKNLHKLFFIAVKFPFSQRLIRLLVAFPENFIYEFIFFATFVYRHMRANDLSFLEMFKYNAHHMGTYYKKAKIFAL